MNDTGVNDIVHMTLDLNSKNFKKSKKKRIFDKSITKINQMEPNNNKNKNINK